MEVKRGSSRRKSLFRFLRRPRDDGGLLPSLEDGSSPAEKRRTSARHSLDFKKCTCKCHSLTPIIYATTTTTTTTSSSYASSSSNSTAAVSSKATTNNGGGGGGRGGGGGITLNYGFSKSSEEHLLDLEPSTTTGYFTITGGGSGGGGKKKSGGGSFNRPRPPKPRHCGCCSNRKVILTVISMLMPIMEGIFREKIPLFGGQMLFLVVFES